MDFGYSGHQPGRSHRGRGSSRGRGRGWGGGDRGRGRGGRGRGTPAQDPPDIQWIKQLTGHEQQVNALYLDAQAFKLYSGSKDGTVQVWDVTPGGRYECISQVPIGGEVDSLLVAAGYLFVGCHSGSAGKVRIWHMGSGRQQDLDGHLGGVHALLNIRTFLVSGGHDCSIKLWLFDEPSGQFNPNTNITSQQGGHSAGVTQLSKDAGEAFLFSADIAGTIKVWSMDSGLCVQTLAAHEGPIMSLLCYEAVLISGSLDGRVKVWTAADSPTQGALLQSECVCWVPEDRSDKLGGVLCMQLTADATGEPVLMVGHDEVNRTKVARLYRVPSLAERGTLRAVAPRAIACIPGGLIAAGETRGTIKTWTFKA